MRFGNAPGSISMGTEMTHTGGSDFIVVSANRELAEGQKLGLVRKRDNAGE
jgi:hypothetical protein